MMFFTTDDNVLHTANDFCSTQAIGPVRFYTAGQARVLITNRDWREICNCVQYSANNDLWVRFTQSPVRGWDRV